MRLTDPKADLPRRQVEDCAIEQAYGLDWLVIRVKVQAGVSRRTGEVKYRELRTRYLLQLLAVGVVRLVTERADAMGVPVTYTVTAQGCDCPDDDYRGRERTCKHHEACRRLGLVGG